MTQQFFKPFTYVAVNNNIVMLLYLVEPESSRTLCCKVYKWIDVVSRRVFYRECFEECFISGEVRGYVFNQV